MEVAKDIALVAFGIALVPLFTGHCKKEATIMALIVFSGAAFVFTFKFLMDLEESGLL